MLKHQVALDAGEEMGRDIEIKDGLFIRNNYQEITITIECYLISNRVVLVVT